MGAGNQFQMMGGAIVLAIATSVFNGYIRSPVEDLLGTSGLGSLVNLGESLAEVPTPIQEQIRIILAEGYNRQMLVLCAAGVAQIPATLLLWKEEQIKV